MKLHALSAGFGTAVEDFDAAKAGPRAIEDLRALLYARKVVALKNQRIGRADYLAFARRLGTPEPFRLKNYHDPEYPEILIIDHRNRGQGIGARKLGNMWHSDSSYLPAPLPLTLLHAQRVPEAAGDTLFVDMEAALQSLPKALRERIDGRQAEHDVRWTYKVKPDDVGESIAEIFARIGRTFPACFHPTTLVHPVTGRRALYLNPGYTVRIAGHGEDESRELLAAIFEHVLEAGRVFAYRWEVHDILLWDNRSVIHCASELPAEADRLMYRIGVTDGPFFGTAAQGERRAEEALA